MTQPNIDRTIFRLREMVHQIQTNGALDYPATNWGGGTGHRSLGARGAHEFSGLIAALDDAGVLGPKPDDPQPIMRWTVELEDREDGAAIDVFIANDHDTQRGFDQIIAAAGMSASGSLVKRLPDYILNPKETT